MNKLSDKLKQITIYGDITRSELIASVEELEKAYEESLEDYKTLQFTIKERDKYKVWFEEQQRDYQREHEDKVFIANQRDECERQYQIKVNELLAQMADRDIWKKACELANFFIYRNHSDFSEDHMTPAKWYEQAKQALETRK